MGFALGKGKTSLAPEGPVHGLGSVLLNSAGQQVRSITLHTGHNAIDVSDNPSGPYMLRPEDGPTMRVVVQ